MKKRWMALILAAAMALSMTACGGSSAPAPAAPAESKAEAAVPAEAGGEEAPEQTEESGPKAGGHLVLGYNMKPMTLFEPTAHGGGINGFDIACLEPLARYNRGTGDIEYVLATDMQYNEDKTELTITLRDGVKFHDGSDFNADVVAWCFNLQIENGRGMLVGNPTSVEAVDNLTVKMTFDAFEADSFYKVAKTLMYSKEAYETNGDEWCQTNIVGTGPYKQDKYELDSSLHCVRFEDYWGETYLDEVTLVLMMDNTTRLSAFTNNEVANIAVEADDATVENLLAAGYEPAKVNSFTAGGISCYPNSVDENSPFHDVNVRKAIFNYGVNWNGIAQAVGGKYASASGQLGTEGMIVYNDDPELKNMFNPDKAKEMLAAAGYENGFSTKIYTYANFNMEAVALQAALSELNIQAEVETVNNMQDVRGAGADGIYLAAISVNDESFTDIFCEAYVPGNIYDKVITFSDDYVAMSDQLKHEGDLAARIDLARKMNKMVTFDECIFTQIEARESFTFYQPNVHGVEEAAKYSIQNPMDIRDIWMD